MKLILVGAGSVGRQLLRRLGEVWEVTVVDVSRQRLDRARELGAARIHRADGTSRLELRRAGLESADALVAATRVGVAPGKFGAWVAAVTSRPGAPRIVSVDELVEFLAPRSIAALPVDPIVIQRLKRLDVETLGELSRFSEADLVRQFGLQGRDALAWISGRRIDPVMPTYRPKPIRSALGFPTPIGQIETLHGALVRLLERALARPARRARTAACAASTEG